jgi:hypothetical protein
MPLINYIGNRQECLGDTRVRRGNAPAPIFLDYLVVGGGSFGKFGAGGGGGLQSGSIRLLPRFTMDVTVGAGGISSASLALSIPAQPSIITIASSDFFVYAGSGSLGYSGPPQLNGPGSASTNYSSPGAGGASSIGGNDFNNGAHGGNGGSGSQWINNAYYGGGGGGFGTFYIPGEAVGGAGGIGGGGAGASQTGAGTSALPNTGGGAGGGESSSGLTMNSGSNGIVILKYTSGSVMGATGGTIAITGSNVYHIFTGSGQFIYQP